MAGFMRGEHFDVNKDIPDLSGRVCFPITGRGISLTFSDLFGHWRISRERSWNYISHLAT
jgi:hypothetical protein